MYKAISWLINLVSFTRIDSSISYTFVKNNKNYILFACWFSNAINLTLKLNLTFGWGKPLICVSYTAIIPFTFSKLQRWKSKKLFNACVVDSSFLIHKTILYKIFNNIWMDEDSHDVIARSGSHAIQNNIF